MEFCGSMVYILKKKRNKISGDYLSERIYRSSHFVMVICVFDTLEFSFCNGYLPYQTKAIERKMKFSYTWKCWIHSIVPLRSLANFSDTRCKFCT
jgi:hypothetical protein